MESSDRIRRPTLADLLVYTALSLAAVLLPLLIWRLDLPIVSSGVPRESYRPFEILGMTGALALAFVGWREWRIRRATGTISDAVVVLVPILLGLHFLHYATDWSYPSWDYHSYEIGAEAILRGVDPYGVEYRYIYPPMFGQILAAGYRAAALVPGADFQTVRDIVFYVHQSSMTVLILVTWVLLCRLGRDLGAGRVSIAVVAAVILVVNAPLIRNLRCNQPNLWIVDAVLLAIVLVERRPWLSGAAIAVGGHLKLYPFILAGPWFLARRWRVIAGCVVAALAIVLVQTSGGTDWTIWRQYVSFFGSFSSDAPGTELPRNFRNNSPRAIIYKTMQGIHLAQTGSHDIRAYLSVVAVLFALTSLAFLAWFAARFLARERAFRNTPGSETARLYGHGADAAALALLLSPSTWEHHYLLALPAAVYAIALLGERKPWRIGIAVALMFAVPIFDVYPLGYHQIAGLLWLTMLAPPDECIAAYADRTAHREAVAPQSA